jgi:hypothetical protein
MFPDQTTDTLRAYMENAILKFVGWPGKEYWWVPEGGPIPVDSVQGAVLVLETELRIQPVITAGIVKE